MNKIKKFMKKHWTRVWLIAVLLVLLIFAGMIYSYAAYTEVSVVKRVVSTTDSDGELFSSNCMRQDISSRMLSAAQYNVTVCNYDQEKPLTNSPAMITYDFYGELQVKYTDGKFYNMPGLLAKLTQEDASTADTVFQTYVDKIGQNYSICKYEDDASSAGPGTEKYFTDNDYKVQFSGETLAPNVSSTDSFRVTVAQTDIGKTEPDFYVHVWAEPSGSLSTIHSRLYGGTAAENASSWRGTLRETNLESTDYDFYNYIITGSGEGTVDILWNDEYFEVNEFFFSAVSGNKFVQNPVAADSITAQDPKYGADYGVGWKKITLVVDSEDDKSRYELQLYKKKPHTPYTGDDIASKHIACFFTAANS